MKRKLIVVDTETAGLDAAEQSILSFAAVVYQDGGIVGEFYSLVGENPLCLNSRDEAEAAVGNLEKFQINAISMSDLIDAPSPWTVVQKFKNWLGALELYGSQTLVAHNATFDSAFLRRLWRLAGEDFEKTFNHRMLCTQSIALFLEQSGRMNLPGGSASLDNVAKIFGLAREGAKHGALEDARLCAQVLAKMVQKVK